MIEFVEELPSAQHHRAHDWPKVLEPLQERPGTWAKVRQYANENSARAACWKLRSRSSSIDPGPYYEFASRGTWLYARFIGEPPK